MSGVQEISAILRIEGGSADDGILPIYDAAQFLVGLARASNIVANAYASNDEIRKRADGAKNIKTFVQASKKGCFEEEVIFQFNEKIVAEVGKSVIGNQFWDYLAFSWSAAVGVRYFPKTNYLQKKLATNELLDHEMTEALESAMNELHRPIVSDRDMTIELVRPRIPAPILRFDATTLEAITPSAEPSKMVKLIGNVTRFNVVSGFGRFFLKSEQRIVPFLLVNTNDQQLLRAASASLNDTANGKGRRIFHARKIQSASGQLRRYVVEEIHEIS